MLTMPLLIRHDTVQLLEQATDPVATEQLSSQFDILQEV